MTFARRFFCWAAAFTCAASVGTIRAENAPAAGPQTDIQLVERYRKTTWRWQRLMRVRLTPARHRASALAPDARRLVLVLWRARASRARRQAYHPPRLAAWLCIHRHEAPWRANTGNGYYGGLQMDLAFQRRYGADLLRSKGRAHRWLAIEQIWVAVRAHRSGRGFYPWPSAARRCGLI